MKKIKRLVFIHQLFIFTKGAITMEELYKSFLCKRCGKTTILFNNEVLQSHQEGKYIACGHCGCKNLIEEKPTDDLREVMKARRYKRNKHGAIVEMD